MTKMSTDFGWCRPINFQLGAQSLPFRSLAENKSVRKTAENKNKQKPNRLKMPFIAYSLGQSVAFAADFHCPPLIYDYCWFLRMTAPKGLLRARPLRQRLHPQIGRLPPFFQWKVAKSKWLSLLCGDNVTICIELIVIEFVLISFIWWEYYGKKFDLNIFENWKMSRTCLGHVWQLTNIFSNFLNI